MAARGSLRMSRLCILGFRATIALSIVGFVLGGAASFAENWPGWRGPNGDGQSSESDPPLRWSQSENIAWKVEIPGLGHSSPIVWEDRVFLTSCLDADESRLLLCLDRDKGDILWRRTVLTAPLEHKHSLNSHASGTPATDGNVTYVAFLSGKEMVVAAYDFAGDLLWRVEPGVFASVHGFCSCPVLYENLVIVNGDHDGDSYLVALDRKDGHTVWKTPRENRIRSYCTPIIREIEGRVQMVLSGSKSVASFDPRTGSRHWSIDGPTEQFVASLVYNGDLLFMTGGYPERHMLAIRPTGSGDVTQTHIAWRHTDDASYVPSPISSGDYFLVVSDTGIASCFRAADGKLAWKKRLGTHFSASPVGAGDNVYFVADDGVTTVVKVGPKFEAIAKNSLSEEIRASPAISQGAIYLRGERHLYRVGGNR